MTPIRRLQSALTREAKRAERDLGAALDALAAEHVSRLTGSSRPSGSLERVAEALSRLSAAADLGGRLALRFASPAAAPEEFSSLPDVVPVVAFDEAVRDLAERDPIGAAELQRLGLEVEDAYGAEAGPDGRPVYRHAFAAARAADEEVARAVRDRLVAGLSRGETTDEVAASISKTWDWPGSYSRNVARTTYNTATTAGRFREAARVQGSGIPVGFKFQTAGDSNVRPGHAALDGLVARADDPLWRSWSPPLGYQCRCIAQPVIGDEVPDGFVQVPSGASKDPGFGGRPDLRAYG